MKKIIPFIILILSCSCGSGDSGKGASGTLPPKVFAEKLKASPDAIILDVRTSEELQSGYLEGARNVDFNSDGFKDSLNTFDREKEYFVYCASGKRSGKAMEMMKAMGFQKVSALDGGLRMWNANGLPIHQPGN
jgi:rhodanese-related sulfurtransferase